MDGDIESELLGSVRSDDGLDGEPDEPGLIRAEHETEGRVHERALRVDLLGLGREVDVGLAPDAVAPGHAEDDARGLERRRLGQRVLGRQHAADLEDVREVRAEHELNVERHREGVVVLHPDALEQAPVDDADPPDVQRLLGYDDRVALVQVGVREVDVRHVPALRGRGQQDGVAPADRHPEVREEPRVARVQAEPVAAAVIEVALEVGVQEGVAFLDRERLAREVGDEDGCGALDGALERRVRLRVGIHRRLFGESRFGVLLVQ